MRCRTGFARSRIVRVFIHIQAKSRPRTAPYQVPEISSD